MSLYNDLNFITQRVKFDPPPQQHHHPLNSVCGSLSAGLWKCFCAKTKGLTLRSGVSLPAYDQNTADQSSFSTFRWIFLCLYRRLCCGVQPCWNRKGKFPSCCQPSCSDICERCCHSCWVRCCLSLRGERSAEGLSVLPPTPTSGFLSY